MKKTKSYHLMHGNDRVVEIDIDVNTGSISKIGPDIAGDLIPPRGQKSRQELIKWWNERSVPASRPGIEAALKALCLRSTGSLLAANLGLSLTDHYWIDPCGSDLNWKDVNLFENNFWDAIGEFQFSKNEEDLELESQCSFTPGASLKGELNKKWIIGDDGNRYLIKGNAGATCQQSLNEVFAARLHRKQHRMPFVEYTIMPVSCGQGESTVCKCRNFTDKDTEFIPAIDLCLSRKKRNDISEYEFFIMLCAQNGLDEGYVRSFLEYQILTDFIITNTDRHLNNIGVIRDVHTLKFIDMAPIFDSGNSMFWNVPLTDDGYDLVSIPITSFAATELDMLDYVKDRYLVDISLLPLEEQIKSLYAGDRNVSVYRIEKLARAYGRKLELFEQFQSGKDIRACGRNI